MARATRRSDTSIVRAAAWGAVGLAALAVVGLLAVPELRFIWIVLLVLAVAAVPQTLGIVRRGQARDRVRRGR